MIEQCVILAGGRGERLRPLTDTLPKPLTLVAGVPFIARLINQLEGQGIKRTVILAGYKAGLFSGLDIEGITLVKQPAHWQTGKRLWDARDLLDETFLLLFGDTYCPDFSLKGLCDFQRLCEAETILTVTSGGDAPNVRADATLGLVYCPKGWDDCLWTNRGYAFVTRDRLLLDFAPSLNPSLDDYLALHEFRIQETSVAYTIDDASLLAETEAYFASLGHDNGSPKIVVRGGRD